MKEAQLIIDMLIRENERLVSECERLHQKNKLLWEDIHEIERERKRLSNLLYAPMGKIIGP
jgi:predicted nuclease with TOPRIM domain